MRRRREREFDDSAKECSENSTLNNIESNIDGAQYENAPKADNCEESVRVKDKESSDEKNKIGKSSLDSKNRFIPFYAFVENKVKAKYKTLFHLFVIALFFDYIYIVSRAENVFISITGIVVSIVLSLGVIFAGNMILNVTIIVYQTFLFSVVKASVSIPAIVISYVVSLTAIYLTMKIRREHKKYILGLKRDAAYAADENDGKKKHDSSVRRIALIIAVVIVASITSIFVSFSVYKVTKYSEIDGGEWNLGVYVNDFAEISFTLPEGWSYLDDKELDEYYKTLYSVETVPPIENGGILMRATDDNSDSEVIIELINMNRWYSADRIASLWVKEYEEDAGDGCEYSYDEIESAEIGGNKYKRINGRYEYDQNAELNSKELVILRTHGKYCIAITIIAKNGGKPDGVSPDDLLCYFDSLSYTP